MPASKNINTTSSETLILPVLHIRSPICSSNQTELSAIKEGTNTPVFAKICILAPNCHQILYMLLVCLVIIQDWFFLQMTSHLIINSEIYKPLQIEQQNNLCMKISITSQYRNPVHANF